jgi:ATP-dependent Clp protease ATP-binding subunit ClpA
VREGATQALGIAVLATHRVLSVGFSLSDYDLMQLFRSVKAHLASGHQRHFAILALPEDQSPYGVREMLRAKYAVEPIFYRSTADQRSSGSCACGCRWRPPNSSSGARSTYVHRLRRAEPLRGRERELDALTRLAAEPGSRLAVLVGPEGAGKSALADEFLQRMFKRSGGRPPRIMVWDLRRNSESSEFLRSVYRLVAGEDMPSELVNSERHLVDEMKLAGRTVLVLDGLDALQRAGEHEGELLNDSISFLLERVAAGDGRVLALAITSNGTPPALAERALILPVDRLPPNDSVELLRATGVVGTPDELIRLADLCEHHPRR